MEAAEKKAYEAPLPVRSKAEELIQGFAVKSPSLIAAEYPLLGDSMQKALTEDWESVQSRLTPFPTRVTTVPFEEPTSLNSEEKEEASVQLKNPSSIAIASSNEAPLAQYVSLPLSLSLREALDKKVAPSVQEALAQPHETIKQGAQKCQGEAEHIHHEAESKVDALNADMDKKQEAFLTFMQQEKEETANSSFPRLKGWLNEKVQKMQALLYASIRLIKAKLQALMRGVTASLYRVFSQFEVEVKKSVEGLGKVLAVPFKEAPHKIFDTAFELLGLESQSVLAFLKHAADQTKWIFSHLPAFFNYLGLGVKKGLSLFVTNIDDHLLQGFMVWLTGTLSKADITLPEKWGARGIFQVTLQLLDITYQSIRSKLVKRLGDPLVTRMETSVTLVQNLVQKGIGALWSGMKDMGDFIRESVIAGIQDWVIKQVIKRGTLTILSFLNPATAILKAAKQLYHFTQFLIDNGKRLAAFVQSVLQSLSMIAKGRIDPAARAVELSLSQSVPLVIGGFASLLRLSGITNTIKRVVKKVSQPIHTSLDKIIDWIVKKGKAFQKGGKKLLNKGVKRIFHWWKMRHEFKGKDGHNHAIYFKGSRKSPTVMMASKEISLVERLKKYHESEALNTLEKLLKKAHRIEESMKTDGGKPDASTKDLHEDLRAAMASLAKKIPPKVYDSLKSLDPTTITFEMREGKAYRVTAKPLTKVEGNTQGGESTNTPKGFHPLGWSEVSQQNAEFVRINKILKDKEITQKKEDLQRQLGGMTQLNRVHLIHHELHGPPKKWNYVLGDTDLNTQILDTLESKALNIIYDKKPGKIDQYGCEEVIYHKETGETSKPSEGIRLPFSIFPQSIKYKVKGPGLTSPPPFIFPKERIPRMDLKWEDIISSKKEEIDAFLKSYPYIRWGRYVAIKFGQEDNLRSKFPPEHIDIMKRYFEEQSQKTGFAKITSPQAKNLWKLEQDELSSEDTKKLLSKLAGTPYIDKTKFPYSDMITPKGYELLKLLKNYYDNSYENLPDGEWNLGGKKD